jgi:hypothetical protein
MNKRVLLVIALGTLFLTASAGQHAVKNKKQRMVSIRLEKELVLGELPDRKEPLFQSIRSFRVDGKGNIYVLDYKAPKLIKLGSDGYVIFCIGLRRGLS